MQKKYFIIVGLLVFVIGTATTFFVARYADEKQRDSLESRAETIAASIHDDELRLLSGTPADINTDIYDDLKNSIIHIREANTDANFVYLMGFRDDPADGQNKLFFYMDSEPAESADYSAPGDFYADASQFKLDNARAGRIFTEGPYKDMWGTWISGYAPVIDPTNGEMLAIAGIDIHTKVFNQVIAYAIALPILITLFALMLLALFYRSRAHESLFIANIEAERERMRALYEITTHGEEKIADQFRAALALGSKTLGTKIAVLSHIQNIDKRDEGRATFTVQYCVVPPNSLHEGDVFDLAETYCDMTVKKDDVFSIDEMKTNPNHGHVCYRKFKLEAYIGVPVKIFGNLYGTLAFMAPDPHHPNFTDSDRDFVRLMGKWMSAQLERDQVEKMKSEFVSVASHQLRTPLTGIKWFSELMLAGKAGELGEKPKDFLKDIHESNERMIKLVENLLNVSRIETGTKFEMKKEPTDIVAIIDSLAVDLAGIAHTHAVTIAKSDAMSKSLTLQLDPEKIRQVFGNLLSNAVKYSHKGGTVTIGFSSPAKGEVPSPRGGGVKGENSITFSIADTGLGIPQNQQTRVFEKFFRADNVQTADTDGTGLGLYIVKAIVEGHGGKIWFESVQDKGTTFFVQLPV